jgi:hypothetical protein
MFVAGRDDAVNTIQDDCSRRQLQRTSPNVEVRRSESSMILALLAARTIEYSDLSPVSAFLGLKI